MIRPGNARPRSTMGRPDFECQVRTRIDSLDGELAQYVHLPSGARHLHLDLPVEDCAFLMAFRTPAPDSSGLTHVLEHLVMCGSRRYPCRRAFFAMLGRTLGTAINALTTEDCTSFHFAARNLADYDNLLSVYLDAAFFPRLDRLDFDQEGCRVELEDAGEEGERPVRRGVVLSEMRGLMNESEQQLQQAVNRTLFPAAPYRFNAGGDPREIPSLDHETLEAYHRRYYHPGNAVFLSAGPLRPEWLQVRMQELALARFSRREPSPGPHPASFEVPPLDGPARSIVRYPAECNGDRASAGASMALAWRLGDTRDPVALARAQWLARCLLDQGDGPIRRALLDAPDDAATPLSSNGVQATRRRLVFQCGVQGCEPDAAGDVEARVLAAVDGAARDGLDESPVDGALAQMEREMRERHDPRYPLPLKFLIRMLPAALYGGEPAKALDVSGSLAALRAETRSRKDTAELVRRCLRDNPERVSITAIPDPDAARRLVADDRALLARSFGLSRPEARERVIERSRALRRRQASSGGESSLPRLGLDSIGPPRQGPALHALPARGLPAAMDAVGPAAWVSRGPTGGLVYARLAVDIPDFESERLDDVGLLREILPASGHGALGPAETRARIARLCDRLTVEPGILARAAVGANPSGVTAARAVLLLSARARGVDEKALLEVLADAHLDARFDRSAPSAAAKARVRRSSELVRNGHLHAERVAAARLDSWAAVAERWQGPSALAILASAVESTDETEPLHERLHRVHRMLARARFELQIVRDRDDRPSADPACAVSGNSPTAPVAATRGAERTAGSSQGLAPHESGTRTDRSAKSRHSTVGAWIVNSPVNYCAKVYPAVTADHPDAGSLAVLAAFLGGDLLQRAVRERGGAYGAGARYCERTATVRMFSYRDPRHSETLHEFDRAVEMVHGHPPEGRRLEEAILRAIREIDKPKAFQIAAHDRFLDKLQGLGPEGTLPLRASVLRTDPERLSEVAERYLRPDMGRTGLLVGTGREGDLDRLGIRWRCL